MAKAYLSLSGRLCVKPYGWRRRVLQKRHQLLNIEGGEDFHGDQSGVGGVLTFISGNRFDTWSFYLGSGHANWQLSAKGTLSHCSGARCRWCLCERILFSGNPLLLKIDISDRVPLYGKGPYLTPFHIYELWALTYALAGIRLSASNVRVPCQDS